MASDGSAPPQLSAAGIDVRCCVRIARNPDGYDDTGNLFITGNALELVPVGQTQGERHTFSRIFDVHASDKEVYEAEARPLVDALVEGSNASIVMTGHHRAGHAELAGTFVPLIVDRIFESMQQRLAVEGGQGARLSYQLHASAASVIIGTADKMADMLSPGSNELRILRDAEAPNGVQMPGVRRQRVHQPAEFGKAFAAARARLTQQHKPPVPSSVLVLELTQTLQRSKEPPQTLLSQLLIADIENGSVGDPLATALRAVLSAPPTRPPPHTGAALLLDDAIGGNSQTLMIGCVMPTDGDEATSTLGLLAHGMAFRNFPLTNNDLTRGLLHRHHWHTQTLHEQLVATEIKLRRGVEQIASDQQQLPHQLVSATDRLQSLVDSMQQDAGGKQGERQQLMDEVMALRNKLNHSTGEAVMLKEELVREKEEKLALTKQLLSAQLSGTESTAKEQQRVFELEQESLAAADVLSSTQKMLEEKDSALKAASHELMASKASVGKLERQVVTLQAELHGLQDAAEEWKEREDDLMLQLLNAANAKKGAESNAEELKLALEKATAEKERLEEKERGARDELAEARKEAEEAREKAASAGLSLERAQLQADQDTLALQRQAASSAEEQLERIRALQAELSASRDEQNQERGAHQNALTLAKEEVKTHGQMRGEINMQLDQHKEQMAALLKHNEILAGLRRKRSSSRSATPKPPDDEAVDEPDEPLEDKDGEAEAPAAEDPAPAPAPAPDAADEEADSVPGSAARSPRTAPSSRASLRVSPVPGGSEAPPAVVAELVEYERKVNATLEANRGLVEAYWRVRMLAEEAARLGQPLSLPSHEELSLQALVIAGASGRRTVPSELEKALAREKETLEVQLAQAKTELMVAQQELQQASATQHREIAVMERELLRMTEEAMSSGTRSQKLQERVIELEAAVPAQENARLVAQLRKTQAELIDQLTALQSEGGLEPLKAPPSAPTPTAERSSFVADEGLDRLRISEAQKENDALKAQVQELEEQLASFGSIGDVRLLRVQVKELEGYQLQLERERSELKRRAAFAEEQLKQYEHKVENNLGRYQQEIIKLRQQLKQADLLR